jgi:hypothetical protein
VVLRLIILSQQQVVGEGDGLGMKKNATGQDLGIHANTTKSLLFLFNIETDDGNLAEKFELCYSVIKDLEINDLSRLASHASGVSFVTLDDSNHTSKQLVKSIDDEAYDDIRQDIEHLTLDELFGNTQRCYMLRLKLGKGKFDLNVLSDFVLLWQRYQANMREIYQDDKARHHSKLILSIDGFSNGDYYRVSRFLYLTAQWYRQPPPISEEADSFYDAVYFCEREWDDKKEIGSRRLWRKPKGRHDDLFPLIPVDSNSLNKVLRVSLESVLKEFDTKTANGYQRLKNVLQKSMDSYIKELEKEYKGKLKPIKAEIKKRGSQRSLFDPLGEANTFYKVQLMKLLIVKDLSWLVSGEMNSIQFYYDKVEKLDLLNLLFMTHFRRVLPSNDDVVTLIEYSEAPSAAINQLLENIIYHSEYSEGLFSIRAHTGSDAREGGSDRQLLESEYGEAFLKKMSQNSGDRQAYIDIRIADASSEGVPDTFARNVKDDGMAALNGYFDSCYSFAAHIDKSSILSKAESEDKRTAFWKAYYKAIKGAALHRGLAVFLNSILLAEGTFKARTYLANKQKQSVLEPVGGDGAPKESIVKETQVDKNIKGTRFSVLYPVHVPTRQYSQIIDIDQEDRVDRKKHMVVEVQVSAFYAVQPIQDENEKNKFGEAVYPALRKDINTRIKEHLKQMESEDDERIMTLVISFDNGDRTKNEAVIKHLGRLFFDLAIENFGENKVKLAIRCKYQSEVVMCVESFYFAYEVLMAQEAWPKGIEAFIFDNEGFYQVHWRGTSIQEVFETDGTRTFRFGGDSLLHTILPLSERIESVGQSLKQISSGLSKSSKKGNAVDDKNKIHPFTLVLKVRGLVPNSEITLFEASLKNILHRDIKEPQRQGYRLPRAHMRLGSKIHIEDFYLVDSVFQNGYYVNGFSNLIADDILSKISEDYPSENSQPAILLIGYGGYSELLVEKVRHYLEDSLSEIYCDYCIYDPTLDKRDSDEASAFRRLMGNKVIAERDKLLIAQIVPTNSTLTTFSKMGDKLLRLLYRLKKEIGTSFEPQIKWNYAPIIVRDQQKGSDAEKKFFECDSEDERLLHTKFPVGDRASAGVSGSEQKTPEYKYNVYCYVSVPSVWHLPGECPLCYPEPGFLLEEQPLIETDKASIIPFSQFGKREPIDIPDIKQTLNELKWIESERRLKNSLFKIDQNGFIEPEGNYVEYRHIVRGLNHYQYYLRTDHIFEHLTNRGTKTKTELVNWLEKDIGKAISKDYTGKNAVHFIISPMHSSNAALLNTINRHVFDNKALIVHSEFEKDFKDNFMAKYFYIKNQIDLACKRQSAIQKPYFCFHYVDDILSHNDDFKRVKELLRALIPDSFTTGNQDDKPPEIKIFDRVILLINRFSKSSKYSFVDDPACFHAYLNINISYIRNQKDACILCNTFNDDIEYAERASTVKLANLGYERAYWHRAIEYEDLDTRVYRNGGDGKPYRERNKSYYRLFAAHRAGLLYGVNDETEAGKAIEDMIEETAFSDNNRLLHRNEQGVVESSERFEWIVSFLKVIARPFPVFRDSVRRAVFSHLLTLLNEIIHLPQQYEEIKKPKKFLNRYGITTNAYKQRLMVVLMNRLATLGGNYLLRPEVYHAAKAMWQKLGGDTEWRKMCDEHGHEILDFDLIFLSNCMRVIDTVGDDSKSYRFARDMMERSDQAKPYYSEALDLALYVENTRILREGINELLSVCQRRIREDNREVPEARDLLAFITENLNSNNEELPYFLDYFEEFRSLESKQTATALDNDGHYSMVALMWLTKDSATFLQKALRAIILDSPNIYAKLLVLMR